MKLSFSCLATVLILVVSDLVAGANLRQARDETAKDDSKKRLATSHNEVASPNSIQWKGPQKPGHDDRKLTSLPYEECTEDDLSVTVELLTDWYANETSWEIIRESAL
jgi:hypothetical protein